MAPRKYTAAQLMDVRILWPHMLPKAIGARLGISRHIVWYLAKKQNLGPCFSRVENLALQGKKKGKVACLLPEDTLHAFRRRASKEGLSVSMYLRRLILKDLQQKELL